MTMQPWEPESIVEIATTTRALRRSLRSSQKYSVPRRDPVTVTIINRPDLTQEQCRLEVYITKVYKGGVSFSGYIVYSPKGSNTKIPQTIIIDFFEGKQGPAALYFKT